MDTEKLKLGFDLREIAPLHIRINNEQKTESRAKKSYGNKYLQNRRSISIEDSIAERLDSIQAKREIRTKGELFTYLANLEENVDPKFEIKYICKSCNEEIKDIPKHINVNKFTHRDLCTDTSCKGYIVSKKEIALDSNGFVISNKTVANGATTINDERNGTIEVKDEQSEQTYTSDLEKKYKELERRTEIFKLNKKLELLDGR